MKSGSVRHLMLSFAALALIGCALAILSGCGQKGPLYLPPKNGTVVTRPAGSAPPEKKNDDDSSPRPQR